MAKKTLSAEAIETLAAKDEQRRRKCSAATTKRWEDPDTRRRLSAAIRKGLDAEARAKIGRASRERWAAWRAARELVKERGRG